MMDKKNMREESDRIGEMVKSPDLMKLEKRYTASDLVR
jgi:hypothetical protein